MRSHGAALLAAVVLVLGGCTSDGDAGGAGAAPGGGEPRGPGGHAASEPHEVRRTKVRIGEVAGSLSRRRRDGVRRDVGRVVDRWFARSFLAGDYPRTRFPDAFPAFTDAARRRASGDRAVLTNKSRAQRVGAVYAKKRQVWVDVLAPGGRAHAGTARFALRFATHDREGRPRGRVTVEGRLFLTRGDDGRWRVFGYDVASGRTATGGGKRDQREHDGKDDRKHDRKARTKKDRGSRPHRGDRDRKESRR